MISVVLPSRNETMLEETIRSMLAGGADEIVVVDDGSQPPVVLPKDLVKPSIVLLREPQARGPSWCRNLGGQTAKGDVVIYSDSHVLVPEKGLLKLAELAESGDTVVCAACKPLVSTRNWVGYGGVCVIIGGGLDVKYNRDPKRLNTTGFIGSVYAATKKCWNEIGWWPTTLSWGYNEQALSLAVLYAGKMPLIAPDVVCRHMFKRVFNYVVQQAITRVNRLLVHFQCCEDFETRWLPVFRQQFPSETIMFERLYAQHKDEWDKLRVDRLAIRKRTDKEVIDLILSWDLAAAPAFSAIRELDTEVGKSRPNGTVCLFTAFAAGREQCLDKWVRHVEAAGYPIDGRVFVLDNPRPDVEAYARACGAVVWTRPPLESGDSLSVATHLAGHWNLVLPELLKYDYALSVEDDVYPESGFLHRLLSFQRSQKGIGIVGAAVPARKDGHIMAYPVKSLDPWVADSKAELPKTGRHAMGSVSMCCTLIRTSVIPKDFQFTPQPNVGPDGNMSGARGHEFSLMKAVGLQKYKIGVDFDLKCEHRVLEAEEPQVVPESQRENFCATRLCSSREHCLPCRNSQIFRDCIRQQYQVPGDWDEFCPNGIRGGTRTMVEMAVNLARAVGMAAGAVAVGNPVVCPRDEIEKRWNICRACRDWYDADTKRCRQCGCYLEPKIALAFSDCGLGKWYASSPPPAGQGGCKSCGKKR